MSTNSSSYPPKILTNFVGGTFTTSSSSRTLPVTNPYDGTTITSVVLSNSKDLDVAVQKAQTAFESWSKVNVKTRVLKLMKLHQLMTDNLNELAELVVKEHGKNIIEAKASITKGMETLEVRIPQSSLVPLY
jgi:malonate-semialdehyde dehydrogenase (acetylating)/methylmalonate-semialdehyde dehydrogenase